MNCPKCAAPSKGSSVRDSRHFQQYIWRRRRCQVCNHTYTTNESVVEEMRNRRIEMYYGWYSGDAQFWDTEYVDIPSDTKECNLQQVAIDKFYEENPELSLAFIGILNSDVNIEED